MLHVCCTPLAFRLIVAIDVQIRTYTSKGENVASINKVKSTAGTKPWVAQVNVRGFDRVSRRFFTEKEAKSWAEPLERELQRQREGGARADIVTLTLADLAKEYLDDPKTKALKAHKDRARGVAWWVNHYGADRLMQFNVRTILEARKRLIPGHEPATVNRYLAAMRKAWNWGRTTGFVRADQQWPTSLMLKEPKGRTRSLNDDEIDRLLKAAAHEPTMRAAILVSIACGMRQGELLRLTWADVDFDAHTLRILKTKNGESRAVHLPSSAATALRTLKQATVVGTSVFITEEGEPAWQGWLEHRWKQIRKDAGIVDFRWHDLRHSCASILAQSGASLPEIGSVLGHQSASATFRYSHLIEGKAVKGHDKLDAKLSKL